MMRTTSRFASRLFVLSVVAVWAAVGLWVPAANAAITYDFNDTTLQGWNNRVWDLSENAGAGGWVDLAPGTWTMDPAINGGVIQPPSGNNNLFGIRTGSTQVDPVGGSTDWHLNTLWLRSPQFYLDGTGDLTAQMARGRANTTAPVDDLSVPYAAINGGGWKGVALRDITTGVFVLAKPRTNTGDGMVTVTFTAAELAPYVGGGFTLDLINSDYGSWGWLSMDNVSIPGVTSKSLISAASTDWNTISTWDPAFVPAPFDAVTVDGDLVTINSAPAACRTLAITGGSVTAAGQSLTINNTAVTALNTTGGTLSLDGTSTLNIAKANTSASFAGLSVATGTTLNVSSELIVDAGKDISGANLTTPTLTLAGGTLTKSDGLTIGSGKLITGTGTVAGTVSVAGGGKVSPGTDTSISTISAGGLTLESGSLLTFNIDSDSSLDQIVTDSGGLTIDGGVISLYDGTSTATFSTLGTYDLIGYSGSITGGASNLSVQNKAAGKRYTFGTTGSFVALAIEQGAYWDGGSTNANWSDSANWSGVSPETGDILPFATAGTGGATLNNDIVGGSFASLQFESGAPAFTFNGNSVALTGDGFGNVILNKSANTQTVNLPIALGANGTIDATSGDIVVGGDISGDFDLTKIGDGQLTLSGSNTYTGATSVNGGVLRLAGANALPGGTGVTGGANSLSIDGGVVELANGDFQRSLGTGDDQFQITGGTSGFSAYGAAREVTINDDATTEIQWDSATFAPTALVLNETTADSMLTLTNMIDLNAAVRTIAVNANSATISGIIRTSSGTAGLIKTGAGTLILPVRNSYTGQTTVDEGALTLAAGNHTLAVNQPLMVNGGGTLDLGGNSQYVGNLSSSTADEGTGGIITGAGGTLTVNQASDPTIHRASEQTFAGSIEGSVNLVKTGGLTLTLTSANTTTGTIAVIGGLSTLRERSDEPLIQHLGRGLFLRDGGALPNVTAITVRGATLNLDNTGTMDMADRVNDAAPINLDNGTIRYVGRALTDSTETLGAVTASGFSSITMLTGGSANPSGTHSATLTLASLTRNPGAMIQFNRSAATSTPLGEAGNRPHVLLADDDLGDLTIVNKTIVGMVAYSDNDKLAPVSYVAGLGFGSMGTPGFPNNWMPGANMQTGMTGSPLDTASSTTDFITGSSQVVKLGGQTVNSYGHQSNGQGTNLGTYNPTTFQAPEDTLTIDSGWLALWFRRAQVGDPAMRGAITSGQSELFLHGIYLGALGGDNVNYIHSVIKDNGANSVKFVMSLGRDTYLTAPNTYTGGTVANGILVHEWNGLYRNNLYLNGDPGTVVIPNATNPADGLVITSADVTMLVNDGQIGELNVATLNGGATLTLIGENTLAGLVFNSNGGYNTTPTVNVNPVSEDPYEAPGRLTLAGNIVSNPSNAAVTPIISNGKLDFGGAMRDITVGALPEGDFVGGAGLEISSAIQNGGLIKKGPGKLILSGENTYTGDTVVEEGTVSIMNLGSGLADLSTVKIDLYAILDLDFTGSDSITNLWLGGVQVATGIYDSGTPTYGSYFTGAGSLLVAPTVDADGNGVINAADYIILKTHMGQGATLGAKEGDFNNDHQVDWTDFQLLMAHYGETTPGAPGAIPEPGSAILLMFGAAVRLGGLRRRRAISG